jgi:hypothetical protein
VGRWVGGRRSKLENALRPFARLAVVKVKASERQATFRGDHEERCVVQQGCSEGESKRMRHVVGE